jgi:uncharacterized protein (TIGR02231 family)
VKPLRGRALTGRIGCWTALLCSTAAAFAADVPAELRVDRVTVYREGAVVTRSGEVDIPAGSHRLVIKGLPASIEAKTLRVAVASPAVRLGGIEVARLNEGKFASEAERELRQRIEASNDQRQVVQDEIATAQLQLKLLESLAASPAGSPTKASVDGGNLGSVLATMATNSSAARRRVRDANLQLRAIDRELERLKADLAKVATHSKQSTEIYTALEASAAATATVSVSYTVADAGWQWIYEARLDTKTKRVTLERQGQVQQGSGEDWKNVEVTLTTALPSNDIATPVVGSLFVNLEEPRPPQEPFAEAKLMRAAAAPASIAANQAVVTAAKRTALVSATEYLAEYRVPGRVTLLADREPRLYPIGEDAFDVDLVARIVPSASRAAHLEAAFKYERDVPIERGRLQLYRDGAFVGEAESRVFLPGADVRMPFGADERIRVEVHDEQAQSAQRGVISKQTIKETRRRYDITNYHPAPIAVEVIDRVPVSRHADVRVEILKGATEPTARDLDGKAGVLQWKFEAQPQKTVAIRHYYSVQFPKDRRLTEAVEGATD